MQIRCISVSYELLIAKEQMAAQVDVDVVNDRLKGIVSTLNSIGISPADASSKGKNIAKAISEGKDAGDVEALLKSLYELQHEAPKIMTALESAGYVRKNSASEQEAVDQNEGEDENDDYEEDDDSGDDDWPTVGEGVSDDISIMSDLTTPTVADGYVDDEEHYHEIQLPMVIGGEPGEGPAMVVKPPKQKSLVHPVKAGQKIRRTANHKSTSPQTTNPVSSGGGAAAKRRNQYTQRMALLGHSNEFPKKPLPNATKVKTKNKSARFSFKDIATERSAWDPDDLSVNAFETAIYGEAPKSPDLLDSSLRIGKLQKQSLMDDTDDLFESGFDAFVPFTAGPKPLADFGEESAPTSSPRKTKTKKSIAKNSKPESSFRRKPAKKPALINNRP